MSTPEWLTETQYNSFSLCVEVDSTLEHIKVTRSEFIELKQCLARMRGLKSDSPEEQSL